MSARSVRARRTFFGRFLLGRARVDPGSSRTCACLCTTIRTACGKSSAISSRHASSAACNSIRTDDSITNDPRLTPGVFFTASVAQMAAQGFLFATIPVTYWNRGAPSRILTDDLPLRSGLPVRPTLRRGGNSVNRARKFACRVSINTPTCQGSARPTGEKMGDVSQRHILTIGRTIWRTPSPPFPHFWLSRPVAPVVRSCCFHSSARRASGRETGYVDVGISMRAWEFGGGITVNEGLLPSFSVTNGTASTRPPTAMSAASDLAPISIGSCSPPSITQRNPGSTCMSDFAA
jgi:hypothetical protein